MPMAPATGVSEPVCGSAAAPDDSMLGRPGSLLSEGSPPLSVVSVAVTSGAKTAATRCAVVSTSLGEALPLVLIDGVGDAALDGAGRRLGEVASAWC